jgi:hypothetical protein
MNRQVRRSVFETNSSSTHSICIAKDTELIIPKVVHFSFGEFGWEYDSLSSVQSKASYLYTGLVGNSRLEDANSIMETLRKKGIEVTAEIPEYNTGSYVDDGKTVEYTHCVNGGYVDHSDELVEFLDDICASEEKLMSFLFSPLSFILTGNDNSDSDVSIRVDYDHDSYYKGN